MYNKSVKTILVGVDTSRSVCYKTQPKASFILHNLMLFYYLLIAYIAIHIIQAHTQEHCDNLELKLSKLTIAKNKGKPCFYLGPTTQDLRDDIMKSSH